VDRRAVHVGETFLQVDESRRLTTEPAPTRETVNAEQLAAVLQRDPEEVIAAFERWVQSAEAATEPVENLVEVLRDLAGGPDAETIAKYLERVGERVVRDYRESRFRDVVRLVRAALALYLLTEKWRELAAVLHLDRLSAEQLGDLAESAAALSDLDVLADAAGLTPLAAGEVVEQVAEHGASEAAGQVAQAAAHAGVGMGAKVAAAVVAAVVLAGAATGITVAVRQSTGGEDGEEVRPGGDGEIVAFAAGDDPEVLGEEAESIAIPEGTVEPGEALGACNPTYVYHYVRFAGMTAGTTYTGTMTPSSGESRTATNTSGGLAEFTEAFSLRRGSEPHPYGEWTLVVEIEGDEVDRASFTLEEDC
jgi:hypothetical protein